MAKSKDLAARLARELFELGDECGSPCRRIEFKGGAWPATERAQGGMCEVALAAWLRVRLPLQHSEVSK